MFKFLLSCYGLMLCWKFHKHNPLTFYNTSTFCNVTVILKEDDATTTITNCWYSTCAVECLTFTSPTDLGWLHNFPSECMSFGQQSPSAWSKIHLILDSDIGVSAASTSWQISSLKVCGLFLTVQTNFLCWG